MVLRVKCVCGSSSGLQYRKELKGQDACYLNPFAIVQPMQMYDAEAMINHHLGRSAFAAIANCKALIGKRFWLQMKCAFVPIVREGWLQYRKERKTMMKSWKVGWFELLADGKLSWFPSPSKQPHESRYARRSIHNQTLGLFETVL